MQRHLGVAVTGLRLTALRRCRSGVLAALLVAATGAPPARAHVPALRGQLVELSRRSDLIVIGKAARVLPVGARQMLTAVEVESVIAGASPGPLLSFNGVARFAPGGRYVFFLIEEGGGWRGVQRSAAFAAGVQDDQDYRRAIAGIRKALGADLAERARELRSVLLAALSASAKPLRYHAALEIAALADHDGSLSDAQRAEVQRLVDSPGTDPVVKPLLRGLLGL